METQRNFEYMARLIIRFLKDELTADEAAEFERWRNSNPDNERMIESFRDTSLVQSEIDYISQVNTAAGFEQVLNKITPQQSRRWFITPFMRYAAAVIVVLGFGILIYKYKYGNTQKPAVLVAKQATPPDVLPGKKQAFLKGADGKLVALNASNGTLVINTEKKGKGFNTLVTPRAGEYKVVLADGTQVWLNALSSLRFPENFGSTERRVELSGEAYFEVAHNKAKPFIVSFNNAQVRVLGTRFNINTYKGGGKATLLQGSVVIKSGDDEKMLKPGQQADVLADGLNVHQTDTYKSIAWKEGAFYFNSDKMTDILDQVARWYDVNIIYHGKPDNKKYNGNIRREASLNQVLEMLTVLSGNKFTLHNRTIVVDFIK